MFDANLRHLPKDKTFIAQVCACYNDSPLYEHGIRQGDVIYCKMLEKENWNPLVRMYIGNEIVEMRPFTQDDDTQDDQHHTHLIFAGEPNGRQFIHQDIRLKAMELVEQRKEAGLPYE